MKAETCLPGDNMLPKQKRPNKGKSLIVFPNDYTVIDIETTGLDPSFDDIIEIAGIKYKENKEIERFQSLINPGREIGDFIVELTGITNEMLLDAPSIETVLPRFLKFVGNDTIVGHNVHFDINFIYDNAENLGGSSFSNDFVDTMRLSRKLYPKMKNHRLATLAENLDVEPNGEHRALEDCITTQRCFSRMRSDAEASKELLEQKDSLSLSSMIIAETSNFDLDSPVYDRTFAFTGTLERMPRKEAMQAVVNAGGHCTDGVVAETNFLVLGNNDYCKAIKNGKSAKQKKAEKMRLKGSDIETISEQVFYDMLGI